MKEETAFVKTSDNACLDGCHESPSTIKPEEEPFLIYDSSTELSVKAKSKIYNSLVALVKAGYPFPDNLQNRAAQFLNNIEPWLSQKERATKLVTDLVPSSASSPSGFIDSIVFLLSSPHSTVTAAALSFVYATVQTSSYAFKDRLVESDLIPNVLETVQPHTQPISGNEEIISNLITIIEHFVTFASPSYIRNINLADAADIFNRREMIFQKVVIPSSEFVTSLISNRFILNEDLFKSFMNLLHLFIEISPYHQPTLEFVLASPIVIAITSCLSFIEDEYRFCLTLETIINATIDDWEDECPKVEQYGKRMMQALSSEGFEDTLEQILMNDKNGVFSPSVVDDCLQLSQLLGSNKPRRIWLYRQ
ncbi:hypothetical protein BLNAU_4877 [Blattamonas nauphoetae]|uniref:Uncharacterized protein n=1 Tax=Blattamonas nauphoetae TaxID=2049346 RepID=A0ABQ9Y8G5_9EUKA|nr:hypothetical protein BLNAU_4877 [Blattamonas nauphoetae]